MVRSVDPGRTPTPLEAFACGSMSTSRVLRSAAARLAARLTAVVVLPTPPFWLAMAMMFGFLPIDALTLPYTGALGGGRVARHKVGPEPRVSYCVSRCRSKTYLDVPRRPTDRPLED